MKKTVLLAIMVAVISMGSTLDAGCSACAANAALKQSVKDAQAQSLKDAQAAALAKPNAREMELDEVSAQDLETDRAPREPQQDPCVPCLNVEEFGCGDLNCKLQALFNCCVFANQQLQRQGHDAKKCCKRLHHDIDEVGDIVTSSSSVIESLIISQIDAAAACCSTTEAAILDLNLSVAAVLAVVLSIFDCTCT